ncbi:MAG: GGDEF domain-containing protein [Candidatus Acidiferrales bacterium]
MINHEPEIDPKNVTFREWEYSARLRELQRREWWIWGFSMFVLLVLTAGVVSLSFPQILQDRKTVLGAGVFQTVLGLICLILLFIGYLTYEKFLINRLRFELAQGQFHSSLWRNLALTDPLTGLYNRRFAERHLRMEVARARRRGYALTLVLFDLNNFKQINDRFGHPAGDMVLKAFADRLAKGVREGDLAVRLGGDEFLLLLAECDSLYLPSILRRLDAIEVPFDEHRIPVNFSVGWTDYQSDDLAEDLLHRADKALYEDKESRKRATVVPPR